LEWWNVGKMGLGLRLGEDTAILGKWSAEGGTIKFKMDNIL
jgi:hypothetical protein